MLDDAVTPTIQSTVAALPATAAPLQFTDTAPTPIPAPPLHRDRPRTLKPVGRPMGGPPGDCPRGPSRFDGDRPLGDLDGYRGGPRGSTGEFGGENGGAPADFQPSFRESHNSAQRPKPLPTEMEGLSRETEKPWRVLEFYSGIGGLRYSLMEAGVDAVVIEAFDINDVANDVYEHNFGHRPHQGNIQTLSAVNLDRYGADAWLLSPPCQPYTRQGLQKGSNDARASSFLKILELIPQCSRPPVMLFVENVVGFETSDTHEKMITMLRENHFDTQEFILSPLQFGVPYSRPRYFCLAKRKPIYFQKAQFNNALLWCPRPILGYEESMVTSEDAESHTYWNKLLETTLPICDFLESSEVILESSLTKISEDTEEESELAADPSKLFLVPSSQIERWGSAMDIVFPESRRCCCFTKSYFRYVKGTGSVLATCPASQLQGKKKIELPSLQELQLRYFTPREVANFHSFPKEFQFPQHVSLRQRYALLGNSLSVGVVAPLLRYLFTQQSS